MAMSKFDNLGNLVDTQKGFISREIYVDPDIYKEELERVFTRAWLFIGHESLIPNNGDFYLTRMGEESVILCRDKTGQVRAFLNSCRHRGMKVCRYESGNTSLFTCPYHSWTYTTDGKIRGVPLYKAIYDGVLDRDQWSLIEVAKLCNYKGTIWATWDPQAPDFLTYLGDATVGAGANIGAGTITCNYDGYFKHRTEIGPRAFIGSNSALIAPLRIGADAIVGAGSAVSRDVADGELRMVRAEQLVKPGWADRFHDVMKRKKAEGQA